jgi:hypothetical protein
VPINGRTIINSDQILQMTEVPKNDDRGRRRRIGVEYTCMFAVLGVRVILVEKRPRLFTCRRGDHQRSATTGGIIAYHAAPRKWTRWSHARRCRRPISKPEADRS